MRVLQLGPFPPPHGGVQTNLVAIRDHLRAHGHGAAVVHLSRHRQRDADEVYYPKTAFQTARILWKEPAQILHLHIGGKLSRRLLMLAWFCAALPGRKAVLTFHSGGFCSSPEAARIGPRSPAAFVFRRLDAIIAVNREIADFFLTRCRVPAARVHLISPHAPVKAVGELPEHLRRFYDLHDPVLLSVGLLEPEYDLPVQIEALGDLRRRHPRAGLAIIGSGSLEQDLRTQIAARPYAEHILLAGDVAHPATLRAIQECRLLLRTTRYDGDALSVREALELGAPVIATDNGMRPPGCRLIPAPARPGPLCAQIEAVLETPHPVPPPAFPANHNLDAVLRLYQDLLAGAR